MKCPFELPVKTQISTIRSGKHYITNTKGYFICGDIFPEEYADYIVQAINSHEKLMEAIEYAQGCGIMTETVCKKFEQVLKEEMGEPK